MQQARKHEIADLSCARGELSFEARIDGEPQRVWFRTDTDVLPTPDAALATCLMPAMRSGGTLTVSDAVSPRLLRTQREFQAIQRAWSLDWTLSEPLREVDVLAPVRTPESHPPTGRVAAFFSGGVDSWSTVLDNPDLTDLIFVRGFDLHGEKLAPGGLADAVQARLRDAAEQLGLRLHVVETNLRELSDRRIVWDAYYGCACVAVAHFLGARFDRVLIAGDSDYPVQIRYGANWLVDQLWSTERLEIVDDGGRFSRIEKLKRIAAHPAAARSLRVCWRNPGDAYNCGHCRKCLLTLVSLEALGRRDEVKTFPPRLDLDQVDRLEITKDVSLALWEDVLDEIRAAERGDLERPIESLIERSKRTLGHPPAYRRRPTPGPPPLTVVQTAPAAADEHGYFATPETAAALARARSLVLLVGGYDGSGNYGDLLQLDAALALLGELGPGVTPLTVVERIHRDAHRQLAREMMQPVERVLYFGAAGEPEDGLVPVRSAGSLSLAACYLYGGGYLNRSWGDRKLEMLAAAERLLDGRGGATRWLASGHQVDPDWLDGLAADQRRLLTRFQLLGARDPDSRGALESLGSPARMLPTVDDSVGVLGRLPAAALGAEEGEELRVSLHFAQHAWVTPDSEAMPTFYAGFLAELGRRTGRSVQAQPLIAYLDRHTDERPMVERLRACCREHGVAVAEPLILRPAALERAEPILRGSELLLSCSYHVAITGLMLGVPTVLLSANPYYAQKAKGLLDGFGLPEWFTVGAVDDGGAAAQPFAELLLDTSARTELRSRIAAAISAARRRRAEVEAALLGSLAGGGFEALAESWPGATPAQRPASAAGETELRLETILASRSWRMTEPLRQAGWRLRPLAHRLRAARERLATRRRS